MSQGAKLRALMAEGKLVVAPGCYDGITAHAIARAGFSAAYMTGGGTAATNGFPDFGLTTMTELVQNVARITGITDMPLIADADTGFGNELNVVRTVREYERAGAAALHLEDQGFPKRCGHLDGKEIIPLDEYLAKVRAAVDGRPDPDFAIIARTDSRAGMGFEEAVRRMNAALDAGADIAFLEAPQTIEEIGAVPKLVRGPCLFNVSIGGKTPAIDLDEVERMGYAIAIVPGVLMKIIVPTCDAALASLKAKPPARRRYRTI